MPQLYDKEQLLDLGTFEQNSSYISQYNNFLTIVGGKNEKSKCSGLQQNGERILH